MLIQRLYIKIITILAIFSVFFTQVMSPALASEISISGNGPDSQNSASVNQESSITVVQNNQADVQNQVQTDANTGNNSASSNTGGETAISTGDAITNLIIENSGNISQTQIECCPNGETNVNILGNGENSDNTVNLNEASQTNIYITQNANIKNNVYASVNTGNNTASDNNGNVLIETGDINARGEVRNDAFNVASVHTPTSSGQNFDFIVSGNGVGSENSINYNFNNNVYTFVNNYSNLENILYWDLNTGGNKANRNNGNVRIKTGDIYLTLLIENDINKSLAKIPCCEEDNPPLPPPPPPPPPPSGGDNPCRENCGGSSNPPCRENCGGSAGGGDPPGSGGSVLGTTLPATGNNTFAAMTLIAILMIAWGIYLRNKGYQKPSFTLRFRYNTLRLA